MITETPNKKARLSQKIIPLRNLAVMPFSIRVTTCVMALVCTGFSQPEGTDGSGLRVRLKLPWTTLMAGESIQSQFILENVSNTAVPVAFPTAKYGIGAPVGGQPYFEAIPRRVIPEIDMTKAQWPPIDQMMGAPMAGWGELPAGHRITWNQNRLPTGIFGAYSTKGLEAIKAHWLAGPETWVSSEPVSVKIVEVSRSQRKQVFDASWSSYGLKKNTRKAVAYIAPIEDDHFLFFERYRVAKVEPDDEFEHKIDQDGTNMEITIKGTGGERKIYYHLRHGLTRETPWPIGPLELFLPSPEAIPKEEIATIRAQMNGGISDPQSPKPQKTNVDPNGDSEESSLLYWLAAGGALLIMLIAYKLMRKK